MRILVTDWGAQVFCETSRHLHHLRPSPLSTSTRRFFCPCYFRLSLLCPCKKQPMSFRVSLNYRYVMRYLPSPSFTHSAGGFSRRNLKAGTGIRSIRRDQTTNQRKNLASSVSRQVYGLCSLR